ncbi:hypothetical protein AAMO2058_000273000 [Amorphochlora amoebiformis]
MTKTQKLGSKQKAQIAVLHASYSQYISTSIPKELKWNNKELSLADKHLKSSTLAWISRVSPGPLTPWVNWVLEIICHFQQINPADSESRIGDPMEMFLDELKLWLLKISSKTQVPIASLRQEISHRLAYVAGILRQHSVFASRTGKFIPTKSRKRRLHRSIAFVSFLPDLHHAIRTGFVLLGPEHNEKLSELRNRCMSTCLEIKRSISIGASLLHRALRCLPPTPGSNFDVGDEAIFAMAKAAGKQEEKREGKMRGRLFLEDLTQDLANTRMLSLLYGSGVSGRHEAEINSVNPFLLTRDFEEKLEEIHSIGSQSSPGIEQVFLPQMGLLRRYCRAHGLLFELARISIAIQLTWHFSDIKTPSAAAPNATYGGKILSICGKISGLLAVSSTIWKEAYEEINIVMEHAAEFAFLLNEQVTMELSRPQSDRELVKLFPAAKEHQWMTNYLDATAALSALQSPASAITNAVRGVGSIESYLHRCLDRRSRTSTAALGAERVFAPAACAMALGFLNPTQSNLQEVKVSKVKDRGDVDSRDVVFCSGERGSWRLQCLRCERIGRRQLNAGQAHEALLYFQHATHLVTSERRSGGARTDIETTFRTLAGKAKQVLIREQEVMVLGEDISPLKLRHICRKLSQLPVRVVEIQMANMGPKETARLCEALADGPGGGGAGIGSVKRVGLRKNNIGDSGAGAVGLMIARCASLTMLDISDNKITAKGLKRLLDKGAEGGGAIKGCPTGSLRVLDLSFNPIKDKGVSYLAAKFKKAGVRALNWGQRDGLGLGVESYHLNCCELTRKSIGTLTTMARRNIRIRSIELYGNDKLQSYSQLNLTLTPLR